jgi:serine/threonine protein kinase/WD40 repeat protein
MTPERFRQAESIFQAASGKPAGERTRYLEQACGADAELAALVRALLRHDQTSTIHFRTEVGKVLRERATDVLRSAHESAALPEQIGRYRILKLLGEGGFGVVYLAEQDNPRRTVAVKVLRAALATGSAHRRFEYEAQILGRLHHPGIAQIFEAGVAGTGPHRQAYYAMEYVDGANLLDYADGRNAAGEPLGVRERLALFAEVCDALQHAHQHGVIHRDLKPDNILVHEERFDAPRGEDSRSGGPLRSASSSRIRGAQPKLLDFGVARLLDSDEQLTRAHTGAGQIVGTLSYMSPEQLRGESADIDTRSDVYSAGVVLYQLLAGRLPYDVRSRALAEVVRIVHEQSPPPLSGVHRELRGDVEAIVAKALAKDRLRRYQSAAALADDIRRYLAGEPIEAKRDSALYLLRSSLRRYRGYAIGAALLVVLLSTFAIVATVQSIQNRRLADEALAARNRADEEARNLRRALYFSRIGFAQAALNTNDLERMSRLLGECPAELRGWEWRFLARLVDRSTLAASWPNRVIFSAAFTGDGAYLVAATGAGEIALFETATWRKLYEIDTNVSLRTLALSAAAGRLALGSATGEIHIRDLWSGIACGEFGPHSGDPDRREVRRLAYSPDGTLLAAAFANHTAQILDADGNVRVRVPSDRFPPAGLTFSEDGATLYMGRAGERIVAFDVATGVETMDFINPSSTVWCIAVHDDRNLLAAGCSEGDISVWHTRTGALLGTIRGHSGLVAALQFSRSGDRLFSADAGGQTRAWTIGDVQTFDRFYRGNVTRVIALGLVNNGEDVATAATDGQLKRWPVDLRPDIPVIRGGSSRPGDTAVLPDGLHVVTHGAARALDVWDIDRLVPVASLPGAYSPARHVVPSPDGRWLVSCASTQAGVWDLRSHSHLGRLTTDELSYATLAFSPDSRLLAIGDSDGFISVYEFPTRIRTRRFQAHERGFKALAFSPDGQVIASGGRGRVRIWSATDGAKLADLNASAADVMWVAYRPDGAEFALGAGDQVRVYDAKSYRLIRSIPGHNGLCTCGCYSPDGTRLVTGGVDRNLRNWDVLTGDEVLTLASDAVVGEVTFTRDGRRIISSSLDAVIRVWETE